jgi:hypothetical protein
MYGMAPKGAKTVATKMDPELGQVRFVEKDGNVYALARNPDLDEIDVIGYAMRRGDGTELAVVDVAQGRGIGKELSYQYRKRDPFAPSGGLTEAGERTARSVYRRLVAEGVIKESDTSYSRGASRSQRIADRAERLAQALNALDDPQAFSAILSRGAAAGAEFTDQMSLDDLSVAGRGASAWAKVTAPLNPILRARQRAVPSAVEPMQRLAEDSIFSTMHFNDKTLGPAAETTSRMQYNAALGAFTQQLADIHLEMRKAGINMTEAQFSEEVAKAGRRNDEGSNPFVTKAAKMVRKVVFDPAKVAAQNTPKSGGGMLLEPDLDAPLGADSYVTRMGSREKMIADEVGFKRTIAGWFAPRIQGEYTQQAAKARARIAALELEEADLRLNPQERGETLAAIEARLEEIAAREGKGGEAEQKELLKERAVLRRRAKRVQLNYAGMEEKADEINAMLADIAERAMRDAERLIERGRKAERQFARMDPAKRDAEIGKLRTQFATTADRSDKAADSLAKKAQQIGLELLAQKAKAAEERAAGGMKGATAGTTEAKAETANAAAQKELAAQYAKNAAAERVRAEKLNAIARRLEEAEALDPEGQAAELRRALDMLAKQTSERTLDKGQRAQRLLDRQAKLDPRIIDERLKAIGDLKTKTRSEFNERWRKGDGADLDDVNAKPDFTDYAKAIADQAFDHYTGRGATSGMVNDFAQVPIATGPLKDRTLPVPDTVMEPWLENDIRQIVPYYLRTMWSQIEVTRKFGRADMQDQLEKLQLDYRDLREAVGNAKTAEEATALVGRDPNRRDALAAWLRGEGEATATKARILKFLTEDEKGAKDDIEAVRDLILGRYKVTENTGQWADIARGLSVFNYTRASGGFGIVNLGDLYRTAAVHGLSRFMNDGVAPLLTNLEGVRASVKEAQLAGQVLESVLHQRMATMAELGDPYASGSSLQRLMQNASKMASKWSGLSLLTDVVKSMASVVTQNRMIEAALKGTDKPYMRFLGIDGFMADRIAAEVRTHGRQIKGVWEAGTQNWTDADAVRAYRAALSKDVNSIAVERSVGDVPLFVNTPTGKLIMQFRTFNLAANQRVLLRGMQEDQARFVGTMIAMTSIGMMVGALRSWRGGEERWEKWKRSAQNPGFLIGEGLDNSGLFTVAFEAANTVEKLTQPSGFSFNPIKTPMMKAFPGKSQQGESSRFASRDPLTSILGPSAGLPMTAAKALGGDTNAMTQLTPGASHTPFREIIQVLSGNSPYGF